MRQNVVDVNHHVTQYLHIIDELQYQVIRLRAELDKATEGSAESSEVRGLCDELRGLTRDQGETRYITEWCTDIQYVQGRVPTL